MQIKEEILDSYLDRPINTEGTNLSDVDILKCMEEYAKQQAIQFGRELLKHADITLDSESVFEWALYEGNTPIKHSTEEMYNKLMKNDTNN